MSDTQANLEPHKSSARYAALKTAVVRPLRKWERMLNQRGQPTPAPALISEYFGCLTFGLADMREKLPREAYQNLLRTLEQGKKLSEETAGACAAIIKEWAVGQGATHFCHWFQPMTGLTAEKHDAFIGIQNAYHSELKVIERFSGAQLVQGEPDASSFPSGGMRSTFEARGYTAWDPSSPIFIMEDEGGRTLCVPTVFFGYHGQALDNKTPLLRANEALSLQACEFLKLIGDVDVKRVQATLGPEQEYFLIDTGFVALRPDLIMTGRTLLGHASPRGQQLEDHYFGSIPRRVKLFMEEAEHELYKLGIPVKTRHNEVAPSQFELAPIFEDVNIAADHNTLTMEVLRRTALKHGFVCLLHEKPFQGINGSGKHNNWSLSNDKGENLLEPGATPHQNLRFLAVLSVVLKAVHKHADCLRAAIASPGNDHRLGANEAPPAIISVFLGSLLGQILDNIEEGKAAQATEKQIIDLGVGRIPHISKDYTDRNRTSPFAFTGNKFEFRAVGSSQNVAVPMAILNAAAAQAFKDAGDRLKALLKEKPARDEAVVCLIRELVKETKAVRFEGNGYSDEWKAEAKKRGLPSLATSAEALQVWNQNAATQFLVEQKVFSREEIASRYHINVERYVKTVEIEHETLVEMARSYVIPALERHLTQVVGLRNLLAQIKDSKAADQRYREACDVYEEVMRKVQASEKTSGEIHAMNDETEKMKALATRGQEAAQALRTVCDKAESIIPDDLWPLPKYREMLFSNQLS